MAISSLPPPQLPPPGPQLGPLRGYQEAQYFKLSPWPPLMSTSGKAKKFLYKYPKGVLIKEKTSHFQMSCAATEGIEELYI